MSEPEPGAELRRVVPVLTGARMVSNTGVRLWGPLLPQVATGLGVSTAAVGLALSAGEFSGLAAPAIGARADRARKGRMMTAGLSAVAAGAAAASAAPTVLVLGVALVALYSCKTTFDTAMGAWIAERVPYERRSRVVGVTETSWALSLLVVIPPLLLLADATSWRVAVLAVAGLNLVAAVAVGRRVHDGPPRPRSGAPRPRVPLRTVLGAWPVFVALALLMTSSQFVFVTFSSWLEDDFGFTTAGVSAVAFLLGAVELVASGTTIAVTDRLGKQRAAVIGVSLMIPAGVVIGATGDRPGLGVVALATLVAGFEFALVSMLPMITEVRPEARGASLGVAVGMGTAGRGIATALTTVLYDRYGMGGSALAAVVCAVGVAVALLLGRHRHGLR